MKLGKKIIDFIKAKCAGRCKAERVGIVKAVFKANEGVQCVGNAAVWSVALRSLAVGALLFAAYITFRYIQQPLVDLHAFRQSQTALTSYWMLKEGWSFAYQTPVVGFPWSIPFEFPIYQAIVAAVSGFFGLELVAVGRFVSFAFLVACAWPAFAINRRLGLPTNVLWVFCALLWTSPLNVYWGRTFMIETTALFFAFASIPFAIDLFRRKGGWRSVALFLFFASAGVLQKATTGGPVLLFVLLACVSIYVRQGGISTLTMRRLIYPIAIICIPLVIGLVWAHYADVVRADNAFGRQLTSKALSTWNFGSTEQKLAFKTWRLLIWERSFLPNAGGVLGVVLLLLPWFGRQENRHFAWLALAAIVLFLLPMLIFTNLHFVHEYYQVACALFLISALSIVIGGYLPKQYGIGALAPIVTIIFMLLNIVSFYSLHGIVASRSLSEQDPLSVQSYTIGRYLREHTRPDTGLVIFGQNWSSEISFQAQRKSMTANTGFKEYEQVWRNPQAYLGNLDLGAIVICPSNGGFPGEIDVRERLSKEPGWRLERVKGCEILLRVPLNKPALKRDG